MEAIRRFASVVPEVDAMMVEYDRRVSHLEVVDLLDRPVHGV
jgi:hypothetical protein